METVHKYEWFEISDPKSKKHLFVNTLSGNSQIIQPDKFQKITINQWWELYDFTNRHLYYYNCQTKQKIWDKPDSKNIISLIKFQILQNRRKKKFRDQSTQTIPAPIQSSRPSEKVPPSRYNAGKGNHVTITINGAMGDLNTPTNTDNKEPRPVSRKVNPRNDLNYRLSPSGESDLQYVSFDEEIEIKSTSNLSVDCVIDYEAESQESFRSNMFPRDSVVNALGLTGPDNNEIWSQSIFSKSGNQMAGIMSWTAKSIQDPILASTPKAYKNEACKNFKQIKMFMGDRESDISKELLALSICRRGSSNALWANEIFMQLCKQVTHNPSSERTFNGWDLICICLMFFHPDSLEMKNGFQKFIDQYAFFDRQISGNESDNLDFVSKSIFCARISRKLLDKSKKVSKITAEDIRESMMSYTLSTIFFSSLTEVMDLQKKFYPHLKLPWIQVALTREILRCNGTKTLGIFRVSSERYKIEQLTVEIEKAFKSNSNFDLKPVSNPNECDPLLNKILNDLQFPHDPILLSDLLRYWLLHISSPIVPVDVTKESLSDIAQDFTKILQKLDSLPEVNRLVLKYFIHLLQVLTRPENVEFTQMTIDNMVSLMAATLFRLELNQLQAAMNLVFNLVNKLDTSDMENIF